MVLNTNIKENYLRSVRDMVLLADKLPTDGLGEYGRIQICLLLLVSLTRIARDQNNNPYPLLEANIRQANAIASAMMSIIPELDTNKSHKISSYGEHDRTIELFENAWTTYSDDTYDHSVGLVRERLFMSGYDESFFKDKVCFDGGCGTGRLSVMMALAGAKKVVSADMGGESLDYFNRVIKRYGLTNIEVIKQDITDLSQWESNSFDFVAANGVLHHTQNPDKGIREHFRITRPGGTYWLYLYGAGGIFWDTFDLLKPLLNKIDVRNIRALLHRFSIREGLIYTFLDNLLAPRVYYYMDDVLKIIEEEGKFSWAHAKGSSEIDDTLKLLDTAYGQEIFGPKGEVRIAVSKI